MGSAASGNERTVTAKQRYVPYLPYFDRDLPDFDRGREGKAESLVLLKRSPLAE
jgi:hypothetical protein